jgi:hypothetical protein
MGTKKLQFHEVPPLNWPVGKVTVVESQRRQGGESTGRVTDKMGNEMVLTNKVKLFSPRHISQHGTSLRSGDSSTVNDSVIC